MPDNAPQIPGAWGVDDDPETVDDSLGTSGGPFPPELLEPPAAEDDGEDG